MILLILLTASEMYTPQAYNNNIQTCYRLISRHQKDSESTNFYFLGSTKEEKLEKSKGNDSNKKSDDIKVALQEPKTEEVAPKIPQDPKTQIREWNRIQAINVRKTIARLRKRAQVNQKLVEENKKSIKRNENEEMKKLALLAKITCFARNKK